MTGSDLIVQHYMKRGQYTEVGVTEYIVRRDRNTHRAGNSAAAGLL